jgi:hypothetical protein
VKKAVIYSMLMFYIAVQLKPITVIIQDMLAHTFWKVQHMATEHHHGHHHVHEKLAEESVHEHTNPSEKQSSQKLTEETSIHLLETFQFMFTNRSIDTKHASNSLHNLSFVFLEISSPPPKA